MARFNTSLVTKVVTALLIAVLTLFISKRITEKGLRETMQPINQLSETDPQSTLINELFKDIVRLDYEQRIYIGETSNKNFVDYISSSKEVIEKLDSLKFLSSDIPIQLDRIEKMKSILNERNNLFFQYLNLRNKFNKNKELDDQIQQLSDFVNYFSIRGDSSIYSTKTRIHHSSSEQEIPDTTPVKRNFIDKLFGMPKKAPPKKEISHYVLEQSETVVDTFALQEEDSIITQFTSTISDIERTRKIQLQNINVKQREFEKANNTLIQEVLDILDKIEDEALIKKHESNILAKNIIDDALNTSNSIMIAFIVLASVLSVFIFTDIAKSNRYKKELIDAKETAETASHAKQQFLANMSHELRTPLQSIVGYSELMSQGSEQLSPHNIQAVHQSSQHLLHIVNQILDYSSIISNGIHLEKKSFDIKEVLNEVCKIIFIQAQNKNLEFNTNVHTISSHYVIGDAFRLKQVLLNLLNNAVKFTPHGEVNFLIRVDMGINAARYEFAIKDTGIGIDEKDRDRIFEEFEQVSSSNVNGNGLGLNIVKKIITRQNGEITLESSIGEGSQFTVHLTFQNATARDYQNITVTEHENVGKPGLIWLIDDDPLILELCHQYLKKNEINHSIFSSAAQLLKNEFPQKLDLVLMDIRMPDISGYELVKILKDKSYNENKDIRFIAVTAQIFQEENEQIIKSGFDGILHKPFMEKDLMNIIYHYATVEKNNIKLDNSIQEDDDIMELFHVETEKDLDQLILLKESGNNDDILHYIHKLAGRLGQMGFSQESKNCRIVEILIKNKKSFSEELETAIHSIRTIIL